MEDTVPSCRDLIRLAFLNRDVPARALKVTLASLSDSTIQQYAKPLRDWWIYCRTSNIPIFKPTPSQFLEFLAQELERVNSYSSINTIRSAISLITSNEIGNHTLVRRFCKGAGVLKPPRPRYDFIWDPAPVLEKLETIYPYDSLSLEAISKKLVLLLALGTGHRVQTLASFKLSQVFIGDKLIIKVPSKIKTSAPGCPQPFFSFSPFVEKDSFCIYKLVKHYLSITRSLRKLSEDAFFISIVKPHKAVGQQTISRWLRASLADCGINTDLYTSHSTRHASTSLAAKKGVSLDIIKRAAGWSGSSRIFAKFYNRPIVNPEDFSDSIFRS